MPVIRMTCPAVKCGWNIYEDVPEHQAVQDDIVAGEEGVFDFGKHGVIIPDDAAEEPLPPLQRTDQIGAELGLDRLRLTPRLRKFIDGLRLLHDGGSSDLQITLI